MYCERCGSELTDLVKSCPVCGKERIASPSIKRERLSEFLESGEVVLMQKSSKRDFTEDFVPYLQGAAILWGGFLLALLLCIGSFSFKIDTIDFIFYVFTSIFFVGICAYPLIKGLKNYLKIKRRVGLPWKELSHYLEASILTNQRWIQKSYNNFVLDFSDYPKGVVRRFKDTIFVDLRYLHLSYSRSELHNFINIEIFLNSFEVVKNPFKLGGFVIFIAIFENLLKHIEENLRHRVERLADGSGIIHFMD